MNGYNNKDLRIRKKSIFKITRIPEPANGTMHTLIKVNCYTDKPSKLYAMELSSQVCRGGGYNHK